MSKEKRNKMPLLYTENDLLEIFDCVRQLKLHAVKINSKHKQRLFIQFPFELLFFAQRWIVQKISSFFRAEQRKKVSFYICNSSKTSY